MCHYLRTLRRRTYGVGYRFGHSHIFFFSFPYFLASARKHPITMLIRPRATRNRCRSRRATPASLRATTPTAGRFHGAGSGESSSVRSAAASSSSACRSSSSASNTSWSRTVARLRYPHCCPRHGPAIPRGRRPCEQIYGRYTRDRKEKYRRQGSMIFLVKKNG